MKINVLTVGLAAIMVFGTILTACGGTAGTGNAPAASSTSSSGTGGSAAPDQPIELNIGFSQAPDSAHARMAAKLAELAAQKSNGSIKITVFPASQLGGDVKMLQSVRTGTQSLAISNTGNVTNIVAEFQMFDLPYLFDSLDQSNQVLAGPVGQKYLDMLDQHGIIGLGYLSTLERNVFTNKPINTSADLKGMKLRILQAPGHIKAFEALGTQPTPMAYSEIYLALQQGVVDGADTSPDQYIKDKFYEVTKYYNLTKIHYLPIFLGMSKIQFDKLSPNQQKVMREAAKEALAFNIEDYKKDYNDSLNQIKEKAVTIIETDVSGLKQESAKANDAILRETPNGKQLLEELQAAKAAKK